MSRTLTITRKKHLYGAICKWAVMLDERMVAEIGNGETKQIQMDDNAHQLKVIALDPFKKAVHNMDPVTALVVSGHANCNATVFIGLVGNKLKIDCSYEDLGFSESDFIDAVTQFMVNIFNGDAILERLNDPDNRRNDLAVHCQKDGVHIQWQANEIKIGKNWSTGYNEEIVPYEAAGVSMPKEQLTNELLNTLEDSVKAAILSKTRFDENNYGCFALNVHKKSSLY